LLLDKFRLGLFDNPYVDPDYAERVCGNAEFRAAGEDAQRRSLVLLRNTSAAGRAMLPLRGRPRLFVENVDPEVAGEYGEVVSSPHDAEVALVRLQAPYEPRTRNFLERHFHAGDLSFPAEELQRLSRLFETVPTIVDVYLDRPAILTEIAKECAALLGNFGASDRAVLDVVSGRHAPSGALPFEMPSSMEAVRRQREDVPFDSADPLYPFGFGLTY
jgi:beta-glucosidase